MSCRSPTILQLQKDVSTVLASFDKNVQDHVDRLRSLDPLGASSPDVFISDYGALGFTFLGDVDSAVEHLRGKISAWTSWLDSAGLGYVELEEAHRYALSDPPSRPQSGEQEAPIRSSTLQHGQLSNEETEETQVLPFHRTGQEHYGLLNWNFPALQSSDPTDLGRLEISPSYDPLDTSAMPRAAPEPGFQHSVEMMQGIAAEPRSDRAFTEPCVESSPGSVGLFVESSIEASPIPGAQSSAGSTIEVKPAEHTGNAVLATIGVNVVPKTQPDAQFANHFPGPDLDNQLSFAVGLASDKESPGILSLESNGEALHDDELIETRPYIDDNSHIKSINKLINIAIECIDAMKLHCQNESHFRQRLSQFLPGTFVDDIILFHLLRMIAEDTRFFVIDPLHLKLNEALPYPVVKAFSMDVDGLVLPINVNASDQMSSTNTNHWVIAVVHLGTRKFNAFGMEEDSIHYWASRIEALASEASGGSFKLDRRSHDLGPYTDDSCCAFLCAYALDRYLESNLKRHEQWPTGPELRERYFRRLLTHWGVPSGLLPDHTQQMDLDDVDIPQSMRMSSSYISATNETRCAMGRHHCLFSDLQEYSRASGRDMSQLAEGLNDAESGLEIEQKARLIQMIFECRPLPENEQTIPQFSSGSCSLKELFDEIIEMKALFQSHGFRHRRLLIETAKEFEVQLNIVRKENEANRTLKRVQSSKRAKQAKSKQPRIDFNKPSGEELREDELPREHETSVHQGQRRQRVRERAVSTVIRRAIGFSPEKPLETIYWKYVEEGRVLQEIEKGVGSAVLRCLPGVVIRPDETVINFQNARRCYALLRQNIYPTQYNTLDSGRIAFFKRWFKILRPDLGPFE